MGTTGTKSFISNAADYATVVLVVVALIVLATRIFGGDKVQTPDSASIERALVGSRVSSIDAIPATGGPAKLDLTTRETVLLLLFREDCPACIATKPNWLAIAETMHDRADVVAVSPVPLRPSADSFFASTKIDVWSRQGTAEMFSSGEPGVVPVTLIVRRGIVSYAKVGVLGADDADIIKAQLSQDNR